MRVFQAFTREVFMSSRRLPGKNRKFRQRAQPWLQNMSWRCNGQLNPLHLRQQMRGVQLRFLLKQQVDLVLLAPPLRGSGQDISSMSGLERSKSLCHPAAHIAHECAIIVFMSKRLKLTALLLSADFSQVFNNKQNQGEVEALSPPAQC